MLDTCVAIMMERPDLVEVLARLDILVEGPKTVSLADKNYDKYRDEILSKLAEQLDGHFKANQIRDQLWQEFRVEHRWPKCAFNMLFQHGSCELTKLDPEIKERVQKRAAELRLLGSFMSSTRRGPRSESIGPSRSRKRSVRPRHTESVQPAEKKTTERQIRRLKNDTSFRRQKLLAKVCLLQS